MTNELEKHFFDTFGIKKEINTCEIGRFGRCAYAQPCVDTCPNFRNRKFYPQITDRILLELICIWNLYSISTFIPTNYQNAKEYILEQFAHMDTYKFIVDPPIVKHQVRKLFEEG